jgi:hypothetical protein
MFRMDCNYYNVPLFPARDRIDWGGYTATFSEA